MDHLKLLFLCLAAFSKQFSIKKWQQQQHSLLSSSLLFPGGGYFAAIKCRFHHCCLFVVQTKEKSRTIEKRKKNHHSRAARVEWMLARGARCTYRTFNGSSQHVEVYFNILQTKGQINRKQTCTPYFLLRNERTIFFLPWRVKKQKKIVRSFFGGIYGMPICLWFYLTFRYS